VFQLGLGSEKLKATRQPSKRRIPKQNAPPIDISKPKQWNNGYIDVIQPEPSTAESKARVQADEVLINGRRYRVPEKIIILDFWNKVSKVDLSENKYCEFLVMKCTLLTFVQGCRHGRGLWTFIPTYFLEFPGGRPQRTFPSAEF
jgi:hypothetical protein